jgi:spermidine synthase
LAVRLFFSVTVLLAFLSGAAGLVWQMIWTAQFGLALGHELVAVLAVLGAFFGGLAGGGWLLAAPIERSTRPYLWYAALEAVIGIWGLAVALLTPLSLGNVAAWLGPQPPTWLHWGAAFFVPLLVLLPATLAMGASLPALERPLRQRTAHALSALYGFNTAGAMSGLLVAVFWLIPTLGLQRSAMLFAALNGICAMVALGLWRVSTRVMRDARVTKEVTASPRPTSIPAALGARLFMGGLLGIGYEVLVVRVLSQVTENTVYTYAILLAVFLLGTALGARLLGYRAGVADVIWDSLTDRLLAALALSLCLSGASLWWADQICSLPPLWLGNGMVQALAGELLAGLAAMLLPAVVMGALFTHLCLQAQHSGMPLGRALGINTLGAALAPVLVGALVLPALGARVALLVLVLGYFALRTWSSWQRPSAGLLGATALAAAAALVLAPPLRFLDVPDGGRVLSYRDGIMAAVSVVEDGQGVARLHINNRAQEGSSASGLVETRLAQLPLLLHPAPRKALFLGLGTGYTANAAALDPQIRVQAVELLPEVIDAAGLFALRPGAPRSAWPVAVLAADARRFVQSTDAHYDVVVADLFHPARSGAANLYTVEHFDAVRARLAPGGLFCQWLALHQMDLDSLRSIVAAFQKVYPDASNSLDTPVIGLLGRPSGSPWQLAAVNVRFKAAAPNLDKAFKLARLDDEFAVLGSVLAGPRELRRFASQAVVNTDDHPVVAHQAARVDYAPVDTPRQRLARLMLELQPSLSGVLSQPAGDGGPRLQAYWQARANYFQYLNLKPCWPSSANRCSISPDKAQTFIPLPSHSPRWLGPAKRPIRNWRGRCWISSACCNPNPLQLHLNEPCNRPTLPPHLIGATAFCASRWSTLLFWARLFLAPINCSWLCAATLKTLLCHWPPAPRPATHLWPV